MNSNYILCVVCTLCLACCYVSYSDQQDVTIESINLDSPASVSVVVTLGGGQTNSIPEPPVAEAAEPKRIVRYYCRAWKDENIKAMYGAMTDSYRAKVTLPEFESLIRSDAETNGGLKDENIDIPEVSAGPATRLKVQLIFRSTSVKPRAVIAEVIKTPKGYRILDSGILPIDLNQL